MPTSDRLRGKVYLDPTKVEILLRYDDMMEDLKSLLCLK